MQKALPQAPQFSFGSFNLSLCTGDLLELADGGRFICLEWVPDELLIGANGFAEAKVRAFQLGAFVLAQVALWPRRDCTHAAKWRTGSTWSL
jgi:hypothetical protein